MGVRRVRDAEYWGAPVGTPIVPGMRARAREKMAKPPAGGKVSGTLARNATAQPPAPNAHGSAAQRLAARPKGGGAWSAMASAAKAAQEARVHSATRERVNADVAETRRQQDIMPGRAQVIKPKPASLAGGRLLSQADLHGGLGERYTRAALARMRDKIAAPDASPTGPRAQVLNPKPGGGYEAAGTVSRSEAAKIMHGSTGGQPKPRKNATGRGPVSDVAAAGARESMESREKYQKAERIARAKSEIRTKTTEMLRSRRGDWVGLAEIRDELGERYNRHDVDEALRQLEQEPGVNIVPESNQKALTQADRDSAVWIGGQYKHAITIEGVEKAAASTVAAKGSRASRVEAAKADVLRFVAAAQARGEDGYIEMVKLRDALGGRHGRDDVDDALIELVVDPKYGFVAVPESNQKTLTLADRDAALYMGNQHKHLLSIPQRRVEAPAAPKPAKKARAKMAPLTSQASQVRAQRLTNLRNATPEQAQQQLGLVDNKELRAMAASLGAAIPSRASRKQLIDLIVRHR